eukprot:TRINITY_DN60973_c0_g1_i1.p1 TRINITY_DN60973_c0_g1~~TRINITY_DN60973_c0_g1_i1.p1  ORF type:complete len:282 (+),score=53.87 TRINITY_DN60973_c0_g1_i1:81-848(+)
MMHWATAAAFAALAGAALGECDQSSCGGPCRSGAQVGTCANVGGRCDCLRIASDRLPMPAPNACDSSQCGGPCQDGAQVGTCMSVGGKCDCLRLRAVPNGCDAANCGGPCQDGQQVGTCMPVGGRCDCLRMFTAQSRVQSFVAPPKPGALFCGSIPGILSCNLTIVAQGRFAFSASINAADITVSCPAEPYDYQHDTGLLNISAAIADPSDCLAVASARDGGSRWSFTYGGSDTLTMRNSKWGSVDLQLAQGSSC